MMRFAVRAGLGLIVTLSASSMAAAQVVPDPKGRPDPLLSRPFSGISFGQPGPARAHSVWPQMRRRALDTLGAPLPGVTAAPEPHGIAVPCVMRTVRVDPSIKSNMPVVSVDERVDPKSVIKVVCLPRD